jgi:hypothetical protein
MPGPDIGLLQNDGWEAKHAPEFELLFMFLRRTAEMIVKSYGTNSQNAIFLSDLRHWQTGE